MKAKNLVNVHWKSQVNNRECGEMARLSHYLPKITMNVKRLIFPIKGTTDCME